MSLNSCTQEWKQSIGKFTVLWDVGTTNAEHLWQEGPGTGCQGGQGGSTWSHARSPRGHAAGFSPPLLEGRVRILELFASASLHTTLPKSYAD